jgi:lipopolysaccharide biosynthesis glycosyltransferase
MNNNVIFVSTINQNFFDIVRPSFENYCSRYNLDLIVNRQERVKHSLKMNTCGMFERFQIYDLLDRYDRVCYVDSDIYIKSNSPNIFDIVPAKKLGIYCESVDINRDAFIGHMKNHFKLNDDIKLYYNSGVIVADKIHKSMFNVEQLNKFFNRPDIIVGGWPDQDYINYYILRKGVSVYDVGYKFNYLYNDLKESKLSAAHFIHFAGIHNRREYISDFLKRYNYLNNDSNVQ